MSGKTNVWSILKTVVGSIAQVSFLSIAGYILARKSIITPRCRIGFNEANNLMLPPYNLFSVFFTPAFVFTKIAFQLKASQIVELYVVILSFGVVTIVSAALAYLLGLLLRLSPSDRRFTMAVAMFMNSNSLPIALTMSLLDNSGPKNIFQWSEDDTKLQQSARSTAYLVLYSTLGLVLRWSYGVRLLSAPKPEDEQDKAQKQNKWRFWSSKKEIPSTPTSDETHDKHPSEHGDESPPVEDCPDLMMIHYGEDRIKSTLWKRVFTKTRNFLRALNRFMNPTLYASIAAFLVVVIPKVQAFIRSIKPLEGGLNFAADVSVPLTMVVLGAYFHNPKPESSQTQGESDDCTEPEKKLLKERSNKVIQALGPPSERNTMLVGISARHFLTPLTLIPILYAVTGAFKTPSDSSQTFPDPLNDPCFLLVMLILIGSPPAITLVQMTNSNRFPIGSPAHAHQKVHSLRFQRLISKTLLIAYVFVTPLTIIILVFVAVLILQQRNS
ncbi:uncharacterized protein MELLADRAFT_86448 [Melampsora larici-populina 98AG31]|uniref:Uncharacterized protein n=1 Tax=Melampsora larici-populina (strain 98AG31 / pathotype 3-4-7) TaxID=747676 RepID=F4RLV4_MELLP|nr:uncharacterized protein MELLADRAFT_86448 [Melampsora larici-populina 98AG31]EGG06607.1 hypothetical protein MELLADRAFT_86448 [Melampsora larici-populina 98AG31]